MSDQPMAVFDAEPADPKLCDPDELVRLVRSGQREALDRMTRCYGARLLAVGRAQCREEQRAQDAVQDALVAAAEHLDDFRGDGSLQGWLIRMVTNACRRMQRGRKNDPAWHAPDAPETESDEPGPELQAEQARLGAALSEALARLDPDDRALVLLADVESWRGPEIAAAMEMTPGQVRTRLSRARRRLRDELAPVWQDWAARDE